MSVVIWEHENFRSRTEKRYQIMKHVRYGLNHLFPGVLYTLDEAQTLCKERGYNVEKVGTFYEIA